MVEGVAEGVPSRHGQLPPGPRESPLSPWELPPLPRESIRPTQRDRRASRIDSRGRSDREMSLAGWNGTGRTSPSGRHAETYGRYGARRSSPLAATPSPAWCSTVTAAGTRCTRGRPGPHPEPPRAGEGPHRNERVDAGARPQLLRLGGGKDPHPRRQGSEATTGSRLPSTSSRSGHPS